MRARVAKDRSLERHGHYANNAFKTRAAVADEYRHRNKLRSKRYFHTKLAWRWINRYVILDYRLQLGRSATGIGNCRMTTNEAHARNLTLEAEFYAALNDGHEDAKLKKWTRKPEQVSTLRELASLGRPQDHGSYQVYMRQQAERLGLELRPPVTPSAQQPGGAVLPARPQHE